VAVRRRFERIGPIVDRFSDESAFAAMAPGAARPSDGNVAGFAELQQALILGMAVNRKLLRGNDTSGPLPAGPTGEAGR
jgi:hypothetical protein